MNKKILTLIIIFIFAFSGIKLKAQSKVGTTAAPFLGISVGPRATAMGGAFAAVSKDATALYYNPGAISQMKSSQFSVAHTYWLVNSGLNWLGLVLNLDGTNAIGVSFAQLDYGDDELVTTVLDPEGTNGQKWNASDMAAAITYARNLTDRFSIGGSIKYIQERIWNESASAFAIDIGLLFISNFNDMKLGMSISNFGTDMRMDGKDLLKRVDLDPEALGNNETIVSKLKTEAWPLPIFFRVGVAMDVLKNENMNFTVAVDAMRPSDNSEIINVGGEFTLAKVFFVRGGYKSLFREDSEEGLTLGAGLNMPFANAYSLAFDFTYADFGLFKDIKMFGIGIQF